MQSSQNSSGQSAMIRAIPAARWRARKKGLDLSNLKGTGPGGTILLRDVEGFETPKAPDTTIPMREEILASPLARKLAAKLRISLTNIPGSGPRGKVMIADVIEASGKGRTHVPEPDEGKGTFGQTIPMSRFRRITAKKVAKSAFSAPHIYFFTDIRLDRLIQSREEILADFEKRFQVRISLNDFFIKAAALTIREFPLLNAKVQGEEIYVNPEINIGVAVAIEEGLIVPSVPQADQLGLAEIARIRADLIDRARVMKLRLEEIERGTFTISSLAQFDILFFTAILNPPQSGILTIGQTSDRLALREGQVQSQKVSRFGLSVDHRIIDGAMAAAFLQSLKKRLENPSFLLLQL